MSDAPPTPLARALGRIPSGLFLATTLESGEPLGFLASLVMQVGFEPPTVCIAVGRERPHLAAMRATGSFTLSVLDGDSRGLMGRFFGKLPAGESPYDGQELLHAPSGVPAFAGALAWLDCRVVGEHPSGDHVTVFGEVTAGGLLREGEPSTHVRKSGLSY